MLLVFHQGIPTPVGMEPTPDRDRNNNDKITFNNDNSRFQNQTFGLKRLGLSLLPSSQLRW